MVDYILFVEGNDDKKFFEILMRHLEIKEVEIKKIEGNVDKLHKIEPLIQRQINEGKTVAIVLDMDKLEMSHYSKIENFVNRISSQKVDWFLIPDNCREGDLESLLLQMTVPEHAHVKKCFESYEECLKLKSYSTPDRKGRVYAYCEAVGVEAKGSKRDYADGNCWNLDTPALEPLKKFLRDFAGS